jgi:hypothetical protein
MVRMGGLRWVSLKFGSEEVEGEVGRFAVGAISGERGGSSLIIAHQILL